MAVKNYFVGPADGWVKVITAGKAATVRISAVPHTHPFYVYSDPSATPSATPSLGSGTVTFTTGVPTTGQTITIGSEVYTFRTLATLPFEVTIGGTNLLTATAFTAVVNSTSTLVSAVDTAGAVVLTAIAEGSQGNYALTKTASNVSLSGAAFTGGGDPTVGVLVCHKPFKVENFTSTENVEAFWVKTKNPSNQSGKVRIDVYTDGGTLT